MGDTGAPIGPDLPAGATLSLLLPGMLSTHDPVNMADVKRLDSTIPRKVDQASEPAVSIAKATDDLWAKALSGEFRDGPGDAGSPLPVSAALKFKTRSDRRHATEVRFFATRSRSDRFLRAGTVLDPRNPAAYPPTDAAAFVDVAGYLHLPRDLHWPLGDQVRKTAAELAGTPEVFLGAGLEAVDGIEVVAGPRVVDLAVGSAVRVERIHTGSGEPDQRRYAVEYFVPVGAWDRLVQLSMSVQPAGAGPKFARLFDLIAASARWES